MRNNKTNSKHTYILFLSLLISLGGCIGDSKLGDRPDIFPNDDEIGNIDESDNNEIPDDKKRPNEALFIETNICSCFAKKTDSVGNCAGFCSNKNTEEATIYITTRVGTEIENNPSLIDVNGWCNNQIDDGLVNPKCTLEIKNDSDEIVELLDVVTKPGIALVTANVETLAKDTRYIATLIESGSGSGARSKSFHFMRQNPQDKKVQFGPLRIIPVSIYSCIARGGTTEPTTFTKFARLHFFYPHDSFPNLQDEGEIFNICHDINLTGEIDHKDHNPRIERQEQFFNVWSPKDSRLADLNGNSTADINDEINTRLADEYDIIQDTPSTIFAPLPWPSHFLDGDESVPRLGFIMQPWIDDDDKSKSFCPIQEDYNSDQPVFKILKEVVGVDTEGLYMGVGPEKLANDSTKFQDFMLIREALLRKLWFYRENGQLVEPNSETEGTRTLEFFWPPDTLNPYVRKSYQEVYTVRSPSETSTTANRTDGLDTTIVPHDRKFACVPKQGEAN